tara:strand:+ start:5265 stop:6734 length:1470 start_codon:yes stop_codon:yes gene_type:complete
MEKIPFKVFLDTLNIIAGYETPNFHKEIADWIESEEENPRKILQVFRNGGKSYIIGAYVCWKLLTDPNWTCIIISAKRNLALRNSQFIRHTIETHPLLQHLKSDLYTWKTETFTVERPIMQLNPSVTISSLGASYTGLHATTILADDVETSDNVISVDSRARIKERVAEFGKIAKNIFLIGTPHNEDSVYDHLVDKGYTLKKIPAIRTRTIRQEDSTEITEEYLAWPDHPEGMMTYEWLERQRLETTEGDYLSQYMLVPQNLFDTLVQLENIRYYNDELVWNSIAQPWGSFITTCHLGKHNVSRVCAAWDAATGLKGRDASVLSICARDQDGNTFVHDVITLTAVDKETKDFTGQCREIISSCAKHKISHVFVEENFSQTLANELRRTAREMKIMVQVIPKFRNKNKMVFIAQILEPLIKVGRLFVHERVRDHSLFLDELQSFPRMKHDDCIDATAECISNLPNIAVDVTKVAKVFNPLQNVGARFRIN